MILVILSIIFIAWVIFASFAGAEPEVKVFGLTFFISFILIGPMFGGILSIHAPVPMDSENSIDVLSIVISLIISGVALGIYKIIDNIRYNARERERERKLDDERRMQRELEEKRKLAREQRMEEKRRADRERWMELRRSLEEESKDNSKEE